MRRERAVGAELGVWARNVALARRGVTRSWISRANARGTIERRAPAVYVLAGTDDTARQRHMVQVLAAGEASMVTADSALGLWCDEIELPRLPQVGIARALLDASVGRTGRGPRRLDAYVGDLVARRS